MKKYLFWSKSGQIVLDLDKFKLGKHKLGNMPLLPLKIHSDFPDPALTLAVTPGSRGVGTPLAALPVPVPVCQAGGGSRLIPLDNCF